MVDDLLAAHGVFVSHEVETNSPTME